jgi:hypothetical protein
MFEFELLNSMEKKIIEMVRRRRGGYRDIYHRYIYIAICFLVYKSILEKSQILQETKKRKIFNFVEKKRITFSLFFTSFSFH